MSETLKLKSEIDSVITLLQVFSQIIPHSSAADESRTRLLKLLEEELKCLKVEYNGLLEKRKSSSKLMNHAGTDPTILSTPENSNEPSNRQNVDMRFHSKETKIIEDNGNENIQAEGNEKEIVRTTDLVPRHNRQEIMSTNDNLILEYKMKLKETDTALGEMKKNNEELENDIVSLQSDSNPIIKSISNGVPPLAEASQDMYLAALDKESAKFKLPELAGNCNMLKKIKREKYVLFNQCIKKAYCDSVAMDNETHSDILSHKPDEYAWCSSWFHPKCLDLFTASLRRQEKILLQLKEIYNSMLAKISSCAKTEIKQHQIKVKNEEKRMHIEANREITLLGIQNNSSVLTIPLTELTRRLEFYKCRLKELSCLLDKITETSEIEKTKLSQEQMKLCLLKCNKERNQRTLGNIETMLAIAENKCRKNSECVQYLDAQISTQLAYLDNLKESRCRQRGCRVQVANAQKDIKYKKCILFPQEIKSESVDDTVDRLVSDVLEMQKSL